MKKIILTAFLFVLFTLGARCEEAFFDLDIPPQISIDKLQKEYETKMQSYAAASKIKGASSEALINDNVQNNNQTTIKKTKKKKSKKQKIKYDPVAGGYKGNIPNIKSEFKYKSQTPTKVKKQEASAEEYVPEEFQKSKTDDPLFLDVILNKEKPSKYIQDMIRVMTFLESFRKVVEEHQDVQRFNANVNLLDLHAKRIEKLYSESPEAMGDAYYKLMDLSYQAKVLGNLKYDANYYSKFSPISGTKYEQSNILNEDDKFLIELDKTIFAIRQLNN